LLLGAELCLEAKLVLLLLGNKRLLGLGDRLSLLLGEKLGLLGLQGLERLLSLEVRLLLLEGRLLSLLLDKSRLLLLEGRLLLLELLGECLGGNGLGHTGREEMSRQRINLTILVFVARESLESDLFAGQLRDGNKGGTGLKLLLTLLGKESGNLLLLLLGGKLLLLLLGDKSVLLLLLGIKSLLLSKLFLLGKKLLLLRGKLLLLLLLGEKLLLLLLGGKLLLLLGEKLLLLLGGKLLLLLGGKLLLLLGKLLLLVKSAEILVERLLVKLLADGGIGVEVGGVEDRSSLTIGSLVGKGLSLQGKLILGLDLLLFLYNSFLVIQDGLMPCPLLNKSWVLNNTVAQLFRVEGWGLGKPVVCGEASAVVAGVLNNLNLSILVQESVGALNITLNVSGLHLEGSIRSLVTNSITAILIDFIDILDNNFGGCGGFFVGGSRCHRSSGCGDICSGG